MTAPKAAPRPTRPRRETSAGGVVFREAGEALLVLLIRDAHNHWGFPKGHVERGEAFDVAAAREVREETGLKTLDVVAPASTISWRFRFRGRAIHKTCHYFAIRTSDVRTRPQRREGIRACRWVTVEQGARMLTHENARTVLLAAREALTPVAAGSAPTVDAEGGRPA